MQKIKSESGITMLMLVLIIIILTIIASIIVNYSISGIEYSTDKKLLADLETVQHAVYEQYEQYKATGDETFIIGTEAEESDINQLSQNEWIQHSSTGKVDKYLKLTVEDLKEMGIENAKDEYIVNYTTGECFNLTRKVTSESNYELYIK